MEVRSATWHWRLHDADGQLLAGPEEPEQHFGSRSDAETWLGEAWPRLWQAGATEAVLLDAQQQVGRPIPLRAGP
jgi:hypothetical protein